MTTSTRLLPVLVAGLALALGGCGGGDVEDGPSLPATPSSTVASSTPPASPDSPEPSPSASAPDGSRGIPTSAPIEVDQVLGTCVYVTAPGGERWALRGDVADLVVGERLTVTGAPDDSEYAECPDGRPFLVSDVSPLR